MKHLVRVASRFINTPLMIHPPKLEVIIKALEPRLGVTIDESSYLKGGEQFKAQYGDAGDPSEYRVSNGVAIVPIHGTLMKRASGLEAMSGCRGYLEIQNDIERSCQDARVHSILLDVDSPGGECSGCFELSDFIYSARGQKPIVAAINDTACSAAYALASAADKIYTTRTGAAGSIGVFGLHVDQSEYDKKIGAKYTYVFAGERKVDGNPHQPLSDRARAEMQEEIDRLQAIFTQTVARNRKANAKIIVDLQAGLLFGDNAVPLLADGVKNFDEVLVELTAPKTNVRGAASAANSNRGEHMAELKEDAAALKAKADEEAALKAKAEADKKACDDEEEMKAKKAKEEAAKKEGSKMMPNVGQAASATLEEKTGRSDADIQAIGNLCKLAGCADKTADYLIKKLSVAEVSEELTKLRAEHSDGIQISSHLDPNNSISAKTSLEHMESQAKVFARANRTTMAAKLYVDGTRKGVTEQQAYAQMLEANPELYAAYRDQHNAKQLISTLRKAGVRLA